MEECVEGFARIDLLPPLPSWLVRLNMTERIHGAVVETLLGAKLVEHVSMDGSAIKGRERALGKTPKVKVSRVR